MPPETGELLLDLTPGALIGGVLVVICVPLGWKLGCRERGWLYRATCWWFAQVAQPLLACGSWSRRALIIAVNNSAVCGVLVLLGVLGGVAWLWVALMGVSLGIALKLLAALAWEDSGLAVAEVEEPGSTAGPPRSASRQRKLLTGIGFALNLLELPAILLSLGLCLGQGAWDVILGWQRALALFVLLVLPLLLVAAAGEALWLTVCAVHFTSHREQD